MSQGATPAAGEAGTAEGGMGLGILGSLFSRGGSGSMQQLSQLLSDPQVLQSVADIAKNLGKTINSANKVPIDQAKAFMQASQPPPEQGMNHFTPQQAQSVLQALGISGGFGSY